MNIISLSKSESVVIDTNIVVKVLEVCADEVWIEIERPRGISVERGELRSSSPTGRLARILPEPLCRNTQLIRLLESA